MPDLASYFDNLAKRAKGGRRRTGRTSSSGGVLDRLRDAAGTAKEQVRATTTRRTTASPGRRRSGGPARRTGGPTVTIEYTPRIDGDADPGEIVWAWVPFEEDPSQGKDRPVVVIGRRGPRLVGIPLTTKRDDREAQVSVGTGAWDAEGRVSYARIWRLLEIDESRMRREGAVLDRDRFDAVVDAVDDYYDVTYPAGR